jgi:hypothetical protein
MNEQVHSYFLLEMNPTLIIRLLAEFSFMSGKSGNFEILPNRSGMTKPVPSPARMSDTDQTY